MVLGCCCGNYCSNLTSIFFISIVDFFIHSTCTAYFVKLYLLYKSNHIAAILAAVFTICLFFSFISNILNWIGIIKKASLLMIPKLVFNITTTLISLIFAIFLGYLRITDSILFITFLEHQTNVELFIGKSKIKMGEIILFCCTSLFIILQYWFYKIIHNYYKKTLEHEVRMEVIAKILLLMPLCKK